MASAFDECWELVRKDGGDKGGTQREEQVHIGSHRPLEECAEWWELGHDAYASTVPSDSSRWNGRWDAVFIILG